ncbi:phage tail tape measure protein [Laribacter hongkongensis]|uniref:phage tail tape measure protein n=1 Tax=Laribacter hongkongensis TaxID=168471 RepID=UPI001EFD1A4B|nr:phage tail tape measure protein [Laribacter hongkongensis]MCG9057462.1 phage tail tape measure protein [Laribacter hongkongensis]MCG9084778.1 phage tail tape measure protein [Laribacter hongkongensis]
MSKDLAIGIVIGGAVSSTLGAAIGKTGSMVSDLQRKLDNNRALMNTIGATQRLQREYQDAFKSGDRGAEAIRRRINDQIEALKKAGVNVGNLEASYARLGRTVKGLQLQQLGATQMQSGVEIGRTAAAAAGSFAIPTKISADYQAIVRDIAIKGDFANTGQEKALDAAIRKSAADSGMNQTDMANAANALVSNGMAIENVMANLAVIGKFAVGQNSNGDETARMIFAMSQAGVRDAEMRQALEAIAFQGNQGSFESSDMARWLPSLLPEMNKLGVYGKDAVIQLGAMLQVQKKASGSADEAANNLKNWMAKIGAEDTKKNYKDVGINYEGSMNAHIERGMSPLEASMELARQYIEKIDPKKAAEMKKKAEELAAIKDDGERKRQMDAFSETMKMGTLFGDMQAKTALTAYLQNRQDYIDLKKGGESADGVLDKGLEQRREASAQKWKEAANAFNSAMVTVGDAIRPVTDRLADAAGQVIRFGAAFTEANPGAALAALGVAIGGLGFAATKIAGGAGTWVVGKALERVGIRLPGGKGGSGGSGAGGLAGRALDAVTGGASPGVQKVHVINWGDAPAGGKPGGIDLPAGGGRPASAGGIGRTVSRFAKVGGTLAAVGTAGYLAYDTFKNAKTADQKAEGYGGAGGALAGGLAGAKVGALAGAMLGPIGAALGGLIGGGIGAFGGEQLGGLLGKRLFAVGSADKPSSGGVPGIGAALAAGGVVTGGAMLARRRGMGGTALAAPAAAGALAGRSGSFAGDLATEVTKKLIEKGAENYAKKKEEAAKPPPAPQTFTFNPTIQVTVKGDVKDPKQVANEIAPHLKTIFDNWQAQARRSAMFDAVGG